MNVLHEQAHIDCAGGQLLSEDSQKMKCCLSSEFISFPNREIAGRRAIAPIAAEILLNLRSRAEKNLKDWSE